jgi:hypothetical protein
MKGDSIVIEDYHLKAAKQIVSELLPNINDSEEKFALNVAGESGSGNQR